VADGISRPHRASRRGSPSERAWSAAAHLAVHGPEAYGLADAASDLDLKGAYGPPAAALLGYRDRPPEQLEFALSDFCADRRTNGSGGPPSARVGRRWGPPGHPAAVTAAVTEVCTRRRRCSKYSL
jgi:hypothetical protein